MKYQPLLNFTEYFILIHFLIFGIPESYLNLITSELVVKFHLLVIIFTDLLFYFSNLKHFHLIKLVISVQLEIHFSLSIRFPFLFLMTHHFQLIIVFLGN